MKTHTNAQLKRTLEKMAGRKCKPEGELHLCWLVEEGLSAEQWNDYVGYVMADVHSIFTYEHLLHANWQQRTIALAKVLNIEIV